MATLQNTGRMPSIPCTVTRLVDHCTAARERAGFLLKRLEPILRPDSPETKAQKTISNPRTASTPLEARLIEAEAAIAQIFELLDTLDDRLEI